MPSSFLSAGSNTALKTTSGYVRGVVVGGVNGASVFLVDSLDLGATPNLGTQSSNGSNVAVLGPVTAAGGSFNLFGAHFDRGLIVAATSNAPVTVIFD